MLVYLQPVQLPRLNEIALDPIVLLFTLAISIGAGLLFGAIPILNPARPHMAAALKDSSRGSSEGRERHRARNGLVVAQVGLAAVLLVASGLMVRTFLAIRDVPPGFQNPETVLTMRISIPTAVVADQGQVVRMYEEIAHRIEAIGGVQSVGVSSGITMDGNSNNDPIWVEDFPRGRQQDSGAAPDEIHGPGYLDDGESGDCRPRLDVGRLPQHDGGGASQREPRARILGRTRQGDRQAHSADIEDRLD